MSISALRKLALVEQADHARELLLSIANDLERPQTELQRQKKSWGQQTVDEAGSTGIDWNAVEHGHVRFGQGLSLPELISEYRALRAAVLRLWAEHLEDTLPSVPDDLTRFNEAIDQCVAESVASYVAKRDKKINLLDQVLSTIPDHACVMDLQGRLLYANRALAQHFSLPPEALIGKSLAELGVKSAQRFERELDQVIATHSLIQSEILTELDANRRFFHEYILAPIFNGEGKVVAVSGTARDITERKLYDEAIWRKANFDALTELPNRHLFRDRLEQDVRHAERMGTPIALMFIDLDRFKEVNDALGHTTGDRLLQQAAHRIRGCTRAEDTVARLGGDEFTVILTGFQHEEDVQRVAQKIVAKLAEPFDLNGERVHISGSVGITLFPRDAVSPELLVRNADQAMYVAKGAGRSVYRFFSDAMQQEAMARVRLVADLRRALAEQEFIVDFQPIVSLKTGRIEKAEALIRWNHPRLGLLWPGVFIETAEDTNLIAEIDNLVLAEAERWYADWKKLGPIRISINKSPVTFLQTSDAEWKVGHPGAMSMPEGLVIEITESLLLDSTPEVLRRIASLRAAGVQIALDDFGTGYSALSYLTNFRVDYLKIDQGFIKDLINKAEHRAVASAIISLAHNLGIAVIAEGVENDEQNEWLVRHGCDYAQGFLFSEALPGYQFTNLLQQQPYLHASGEVHEDRMALHLKSAPDFPHHPSSA